MTHVSDDARPRTLIVTPDPSRHGAERYGARVLVPAAAAAAALGVPARTPGTLARQRIAEAGWTVASPLARQRRLRQAVLEAWGSEDAAGAVRAVGPALHDLLRAGVGAAGDAELERLNAAASARAARLLALTARYLALLRDDRLVDPDEALWRAAELAEVGQGDGSAPWWILLPPRPAPGERAFLDAIAGPGSRVVLVRGPGDTDDEADVRPWTARGWTWRLDERHGDGPGAALAARFRSGAPAAPGSSPRKARAWLLPTQEEEVRAVLVDVKRRLHHGARPEQLALVARDPHAYGPLLSEIAREYGLPLHRPQRVPARDTRAGAWFALLAEAALDGAGFEATARLLAHPFSGGLAGGSWGAARRGRTSGPRAWARLLAEQPERAEVLRWPRRATRAAHHAHLREALRALQLKARVRELGSLRDDLALHRLVGAMQGLARPASEQVARGTFLTELRELTALVAVPLDPGGRGVTLYEPGELAGGAVEHLYVLGAAEGELPPPVRDDPALDFFERAALRAAGLPLADAYGRALDEERAFQAVLLAARGSLVISRPASLAGEARPQSPYLERLGLGSDTPPVPAASPEQARRTSLSGAASDPVTEAARRAWSVEVRRESAADFDAFDGVTGLPWDAEAHRLSATQLLDLGQCAFKWFARRVLHAEEPEEAEEEVTPLQRGQLWHRALELAVAEARADGARGGAQLRERAEDALERAFERAEREVLPDLPTWTLRRREHLDALRRVLRREDFLPDDAQVLSQESSFAGTWRGLPVTGRIDRIDRGPDGLILTDYKTRGSKPEGAQDASGRLRHDVQLPLYAEMAAQAYPGERVAEARYYSLTRAEPIRARAPSDQELQAFAERARGHLDEGRFPVQPDRDANACRLCDLEPVCRRGPRLDRKGHR